MTQMRCLCEKILRGGYSEKKYKKYGGEIMFCPNCGYENNDENQFCMKCGRPILQKSQKSNPNTDNLYIKSGNIPVGAPSDANGDGKLNVRDAAAIAKYIAQVK